MSEPRIAYLLENSQEPDIRLRDAILFRALSRALGDDFYGHDNAYRIPDAPVMWGPDPHGMMDGRLRAAARAYLHPEAMRIMGAEQVSDQTAQAAFERISETGRGAVIRNLARPDGSLRHTQPGDRFEQHRSAITWDSDKDPAYVIYPDGDGLYPRRMLVVDGKVVAHTPMTHDESAPVHIAPGDLSGLTSKDIFSRLTNALPEPFLAGKQITAAKRLRHHAPMAHGAIDVTMTADGTPMIEAIHVGPPGSFDIFWAPAEVYAEAVREALPVIEPALAEEPEPGYE